MKLHRTKVHKAWRKAAKKFPNDNCETAHLAGELDGLSWVLDK
jgi:hypothetical protein